jgi:hypothetical protein
LLLKRKGLGKNIKEAQKYQLALEEFVGTASTGNDPIISTLKPKTNPTTKDNKIFYYHCRSLNL